MSKRRRGTAIVETERGVLLTAMHDGVFLLPGGGADPGESRFRAAIRELEEETGLVAHFAQLLFQHESHSQDHTVVYIEAMGTPTPQDEVEQIAYYTAGSDLNMSRGTRDIIERYYARKQMIVRTSV